MQCQGQELITFKKSCIGTKLPTCTKVFNRADLLMLLQPSFYLCICFVVL